MLYSPILVSRYSVLPALSLYGVTNVLVVKGSITGDIFAEFVTDLMRTMNPYPGPNSVLVMDNASIHRNEELEESAKERLVRILMILA